MHAVADEAVQVERLFLAHAHAVGNVAVTTAAWASMKSPALGRLNEKTGIERTAMQTLHSPLPQEIPMPL